jgi:site-specific recombinase XerD
MVMEERTLDSFLSIYQNFSVAENKSPRTIEGTIAAVKDFDRFLGSPDDINKIQAEDLRKYIRYLQSRQKWSLHPTISKTHGQLTPHAIATYTRTIRAFFSWLTREGFLDSNPFQSVKPPKATRKIVTTLTSGEVRQFLETIPRHEAKGYRDLAFFLTLYGTGVRLNELTSLKKVDVNFDSGQFRIMGKGSKERVISMSAHVFKVLLKYETSWRPKSESPYFFIDNKGRRLNRFVIAHRMKNYLLKSGLNISHFTPHTLRHTFAVQFLRNGGDVFSLQKILGHASLDMTRHYAELAQSDVDNKMKAYSPAESIDIKV